MFVLFSLQAGNENTKIHLAESDIREHFKRISDYLILADGVWWKRDGDSIVFFDGDKEPVYFNSRLV